MRPGPPCRWLCRTSGQAQEVKLELVSLEWLDVYRQISQILAYRQVHEV